jgi:hypothetical protein
MSFRVRDVPRDGNCLFESIGRSLGVPAVDLRALVVSFLKVPNQKLQKEPLKVWITELDDYIQKISKNGFWGGGLEIGILAQIFNRRIVVYSKSDKKKAEMIAEYIPEEDIFSAVYILYVGRNHYMQLLPNT